MVPLPFGPTLYFFRPSRIRFVLLTAVLVGSPAPAQTASSLPHNIPTA